MVEEGGKIPSEICKVKPPSVTLLSVRNRTITESPKHITTVLIHTYIHTLEQDKGNVVICRIIVIRNTQKQFNLIRLV